MSEPRFTTRAWTDGDTAVFDSHRVARIATCRNEMEAGRISHALNAAHARGELDAPKQQPDWEALCRNLVGEIYETGWCIPARQWDPIYRAGWNQACADVQSSKAATAARDAVRASEPEPDERNRKRWETNTNSDGSYLVSPDGRCIRFSAPAESQACADALNALMDAEPDERVKDVGRLQYTGGGDVRTRGDDCELVTWVYTQEYRGFSRDEIGKTCAELLNKALDRRQRTGTRADRREGGA